MKKLLLIGLLALSLFHSASALTINPLVEGTYEKPIYGQPVVLNERIFYMQKESAFVDKVVVYNLALRRIERSMSGDFLQDDQLQSLFLIDDHVYVVVYDQNEGATQLWRTQGEFFTQVNLPVTIDRFADLGYNNGTLFITAADNTVLTIDDQQIIQQSYPTRVNFYQDRCAFAADDYVMALRGENGRFIDVVRYSHGTITELSAGLPDQLHYDIIQNGNTCLLGFEVQAHYESLVVIEANTPARVLAESLDVSAFDRLFSFNNHWYALARFEDGTTSSVAKLDLGNSTVSARFDVDPVNQFYSVRTTQDRIVALSTTPTASPRVDIAWYLDENLELDESLTSTNQPIPFSYPFLGGELLATYEYKGRRYDYSLFYSYNPPPESILTLNRHHMRRIINSTDREQVYLMLEHVNTRRVGIYELVEQPKAGLNLAGIWHDPDLASQGMVVTTGERQDGSPYQFITFYTYEDGQPLWLAGLNEMRLGQTLVVTDLFRYQGGQMFSGDASPQQEVFGSLSLELLGCHQVEVIFSRFQQADQLFTLERIENFDQDQPCVDLNQ
jgi:hypothetical protein